MSSDLDVAVSVAVPLIIGTFLAAVLFRTVSEEGQEPSSGMPSTLREAGALWLAPIVNALIAMGVSASGITSTSLVLGILAATLVATGHFGVASLVFLVAALCDALDGLVARATRTDSVSGALFDASADRYQEFFMLGGLALFFRENAVLLGDVLLAIAGSFMVSYGSAKAEAFAVPVPEGRMRRADRAIWIGAGILLTPLAQSASAALSLPESFGFLPVLLAVTVIGVFANASAIRRIRAVALAVEPVRPSRLGRRPSVEAERWTTDHRLTRDDRAPHEAPITRHAL